MGKGDKKTKRGKVIIKSFGVKRPARKKTGETVANVSMNNENSDATKTTAKKTTKKPAKKETKE